MWKKNVWCVCDFVVVMLLASSHSAQAQATAVGPYYATPSWDQTFPCTATSCPRFVVLSNFNNEAVLDRETGLVWMRSPNTLFPSSVQRQAASICRNGWTGGRFGWRLPSITELSSLADASKFVSLPDPFIGVSGEFWSGTHDDVFTASQFTFNFSSHSIGLPPESTDEAGVLCVRGPQPN